MKNPSAGGASSRNLLSRNRRLSRGFALVISLSLMVLLTILAVGLLGLSTLSLATAARESDLAEARANARMSLALAIAQLQKQTGPDQRVTVTADQLGDGDGETTVAAADKRHWAGVYNAWDATTRVRPQPEFREWLVSGDSDKVSSIETAKGTSAADDELELVGIGTVGDVADARVKVPSLRVDSFAGGAARIAWWSGDQGVKAALSSPTVPEDKGLSNLRGLAQAAPRGAVELVGTGDVRPFESLSADDVRLPLVTSWQQSGFLADDVKSPRALFHDLASSSSGLLTNVRGGGFRKDLSMQFERPVTSAAATALYTVAGEPGINLQELQTYYNLYKQVMPTGGQSYTTGGKVPSRGPVLLVGAGPGACANDEWFHMKMPVIINYQLVLSLKTQVVEGVNRLHLVADPIITFWNPLDVPVVLPAQSFVSVKFWQVPYTLYLRLNGGPVREFPIAASVSGARDGSGGVAANNGDSNFCSLVVGNTQQLVLKPGEVVKTSQQGPAGSVRHRLPGAAGFFSQHGFSLPVRGLNGGYMDIAATDTLTYELRANQYTAGKKGSSGNSVTGGDQHSRHFSLTHHEVYIGWDRASNNDYSSVSDSLGYGGMYIDYDFGNKRLRASELRSTSQAGTKAAAGARLYANSFPKIFRPVLEADGRPLAAGALLTKSPIALLSYSAKTEAGSDLGTRFLSRFNPKVHHIDFFDLSAAERDMLPYEFSVEPLVSWKNRSLDVDTDGRAYFGGGLNTEMGSSFVTTHSVPREPLVSLASFQHSFANGFEIQKPKYGYSTLNSREPMMPQISHAIGNSLATPVLAKDKTEGTLPGARPLADHSYLANQGLWDDWFLSGIAPQTRTTYTKQRAQRVVAEELLKGTGKVPVLRYFADLDGEAPDQVLSSLFSGGLPSAAAIQNVASYLRVDGLFNVNSTSVEAWKALLGGLKDRPVVVRDADGTESIAPMDEEIPVTNLHGPQDQVVDGSSTVSSDEEPQWVGRRTLTEDEIDQLARAIVKEVRRRGPFLSLADFINRRVGSDTELARAGAIQSALDSEEVEINRAFGGSRGVASDVTKRFAFPEAEEGPMAYGSPTVVKQADILTPIAPVLSARSDSFIIRAYGESVDKNGKVLARAWCEAVVERDREYVDSSDRPQVLPATLRDVNKAFGRRYEIVSFRWLHPEEV